MQNLCDKSYSTIEGNKRKRENGNPCRILDRKIHYNSAVIPFPNPIFTTPPKQYDPWIGCVSFFWGEKRK